MRDRIVGALVLLAVVQVGLLAMAFTSAGDGAVAWFRKGDSLAGIELRDRDGVRRSLATGRPTLVLVFHSECGHCARVAPDWRDWLERHESGVSVVALSSESPEEANRYSSDHGWGVDAWTVAGIGLGSRAHAITARTPWLFAVDGDGVVIDAAHGWDIERIGGLVASGHSGAADAR